MPKTILQAIKEKLTSGGSTVAEGLGSKGLTVSEAIDELELGGGGGTTPTGTLTIRVNTSENGIDCTQFARVVVNVVPHFLTYSPNNGGVNPDVTEVHAEEQVVILPITVDYTRPQGKRFDGWATDPEGQNPITNGRITMTGDTTVYVRWVDDV